MRRGVRDRGEASAVGVVAAPELCRVLHNAQRLAGPERYKFPDVTEVVHHCPYTLGGNPVNELGWELLYFRKNIFGGRDQLVGGCQAARLRLRHRDGPHGTTATLPAPDDRGRKTGWPHRGHRVSPASSSAPRRCRAAATRRRSLCLSGCVRALRPLRRWSRQSIGIVRSGIPSATTG